MALRHNHGLIARAPSERYAAENYGFNKNYNEDLHPSSIS